MVHEMRVPWPEQWILEAPESTCAPVFQLILRRTHLVEDTFRQLAATDDSVFKRELLVNIKTKMITSSFGKADLYKVT